MIIRSLYMKTLVTHINPHLDDITSIWLFKKYQPDFRQAEVEFISASRTAASKQSEDRIFLGTGGGQFDEHKEGLNTCAGTLVYQYLKEKGLIPKSEITQKALEGIIKWNELIDTGKASGVETAGFSVPAFVRTKDSSSQSSKRSVELGIEILDRILAVLERKEESIKDWEGRVEFETKFGKSFAVVSKTIDREFCREMGGDLFLMYDPKYKSVQFFTPSFEIDLEPIYKKAKEADPEASWFLHQSHHMVICGSSSAPDSKPTKLSFEELIKIAKEA